MTPPGKPGALNIFKVELTVFARIVGKQVIKKLRTLAGDYRYSINNLACGKEKIYSLLVSAGFPPGHPYLEVFLEDDTGGTAAEWETPENEAKEAGYDKDLKADVYIILDNRSKALDITEELVSFSKKHNSAAELEYFITGIQCRPKDIRELFAGAGIKPGAPVYDSLLDE